MDKKRLLDQEKGYTQYLLICLVGCIMTGLATFVYSVIPHWLQWTTLVICLFGRTPTSIGRIWEKRYLTFVSPQPIRLGP